MLLIVHVKNPDAASRVIPAMDVCNALFDVDQHINLVFPFRDVFAHLHDEAPGEFAPAEPSTQRFKVVVGHLDVLYRINDNKPVAAVLNGVFDVRNIPCVNEPDFFGGYAAKFQPALERLGVQALLCRHIQYATETACILRKFRHVG